MRIQHITTRVRGLFLALAAISFSAVTVQAQQTDEQKKDSTKWGRAAVTEPEVQNPPGYRGMERPVNVFPADSADSADTTAGAVQDRVTGKYDDSTWQDTSDAPQNPPGYRGMERPVGTDSVADTTANNKVKADTAAKKKVKKEKIRRYDDEKP